MKTDGSLAALLSNIRKLPAQNVLAVAGWRAPSRPIRTTYAAKMAVRTISTLHQMRCCVAGNQIFFCICHSNKYFEPLTQIIFSAGAGDPRGGFLPGDRGPRISCDIKPQVGSLYSTRRCYVRWSSNLQCAIPELRPAPAPTKPRMNFVLWFEV